MTTDLITKTRVIATPSKFLTSTRSQNPHHNPTIESKCIDGVPTSRELFEN